MSTDTPATPAPHPTSQSPASASVPTLGEADLRAVAELIRQLDGQASNQPVDPTEPLALSVPPVPEHEEEAWVPPAAPLTQPHQATTHTSPPTQPQDSWTPRPEAPRPGVLPGWSPSVPPVASMPAPEPTRGMEWSPSSPDGVGSPSSPSAWQPRRAIGELLADLDHQPTATVTGWRKLFHRGASKAELARADDLKWLRCQFPRPLIIAVATPKGGAGKTPTAVGLGAAYGLARGSGVVVWDNNELRGTLAERTFISHRNTVITMLNNADALLRPDARVADVQAMLNYQPSGQFWALGSSEKAGQAITSDQFQTIREILSRFFSIIIIDTGNNEVAPNWIETVLNADILLVPVKWRKDNMVSARRMIDTLTEDRRDIVNRMMIVGTNGPGELMPALQAQAASWFEPSPILEVPTDLHIAQGAEIDWNLLQPTTRRAYETLGASVNRLAADYLSNRLRTGHDNRR